MRIQRWKDVLVWMLLVALAGPARAQVEPVPGIDLPFFFDDFHYPVQVPEDFDPPNEPYPQGYVFGPNGWFVAGGPAQPWRLEHTRGWYVQNWFEYGGWAWNYEGGQACDASWFDACGHVIVTDPEAIRAGVDGLARLDRGTKPYAPNFVLLRANPGRYSDAGSIRLSSGFAARSGTWVARVMLPDFDGLRFHEPVGGAVDERFTFFPAFWLQGSESAIDVRDDVYKIADLDLVWSEASIEINNWFDPDAPDGHEAIMAGTTWSNRYLSNRTIKPRTGTAGAAGKCRLVDDAGRERTDDTDPRTCFNLLTGKAAGPVFVTLYIVVSETETKFYFTLRDEDLHLTRGDFYEGVDVLSMESIDTLRHFVPPRFMRTLFDLNLRRQSGGTGILHERKDMVLDWVFYTPRILTPSSSPALDDVPELVVRTRDHLWQRYNRTRASREQVWRVNTTGYPTGRPVDETRDNPCLLWNDRRAPLYGYRPVVKSYTFGDRLFFTPEATIDLDANLYVRQTVFSVEWNVFERLETGRRVLRDHVRDHGYVYEAPTASAWWRNARDLEIEMTLRELADPGLSQTCGVYMARIRP